MSSIKNQLMMPEDKPLLGSWTNQVLRYAAGALFKATSQISDEIRVDDVLRSIKHIANDNEHMATTGNKPKATCPYHIPSKNPTITISSSEDQTFTPSSSRSSSITMPSAASSILNLASRSNSISMMSTGSSSCDLTSGSSSMTSASSFFEAIKDDEEVEEVKLNVYSLDEVREHCYPNDAWMVIYDNVYDVTEFLNEHPAGSEVMQEYIGHDASEAFRSVGHSEDAHEMLQQYLIGELPENERIFPKGQTMPR